MTALRLILIIAILASGDSGLAASLPPDNTPPLPSSQFEKTSYNLTLEKSRANCQSQSCRWWHDYIAAKYQTSDNSSKSCELFKKLSEESDFPLRPIALVHRQESCADDKEQETKTLQKIQEYLKEQKPKKWIVEILTDAAMESARAAESPDFFDLAIAATKNSNTKKEKAAILQEALAIAEKKSDSHAASLRAELYNVAPRFNPKPDDWSVVGQDALNNHDFETAMKAYEKVVNAKTVLIPVRRQAYENLKTSYKALQKKKEAFKISERYFKWELSLLQNKKVPADEPKHALSSGIAFAKYLWTEHKSHDALKLLDKIEKKLNGKTDLSELYFVRGRINEELAKPSARGWIEKAITTTSNAQFRSQFGWNYAWLNYKEGNYERARQVLEEMQSTEPDVHKRSQQMFWLGKSYQNLSRPDDARQWFEKIIQDDPLSYYSLISYRELKKPIPSRLETAMGFISRIPKKIFGPDKKPKDTGSPMFQWLISTGELKYAQDYLDDEVPIPDSSSESVNAAFELYTKAAYFPPVFLRLTKMTPAEAAPLLAEHPEFLFPRNFSEAVDEGSRQSGLWPEYIFAIMRQESSFDPLAVSPANAYGLLQLLPDIAKQLAGKMAMTYKSPEDLFDPHLNVILGSQHLRRYWDKFDGQFVLATAAYNASPATVKTWVKTRFRGDPLMFIEDIPYEETRLYVKLVLRNFIHYQMLSAATPSIDFPEWCLEGIQASKN